VLGAAWAVIQPVITMVVFTLIFGKLAGIESDGLPYALFSLTALVPWTYFSTALNGASNSLISNPALITKIYFPRLVLPAAPVLAGLVDFVIAFLILLGMTFAFGFVPSAWALLLIPGSLLIAMATALGTGSWLAALNVRYRDVKYVTPFLVQIWMYMSPIVYPASLVPERFRLLYSLNPMVSVVEGFRLGLTGVSSLAPAEVAVSVLAASALLLSGGLYFRHSERVFADVV
jgi:lipopolysaccharide transport system permease protein